MISLNSAIDAVLAAVRPFGPEEVPLLDGLGRGLAADVVSPEAVPPFDNSAMDGFALRAADAVAAGGAVIALEVPAGSVAPRPLAAGEAARIMTGAPMPAGADTVVPVEETEERGGRVFFGGDVRAGANVRRAGEDVAAGSLLLPAGTGLGAAEVGLLASVGLERVAVARRPRVAVLATGSELVAAGEPLGPGQIRNSNSVAAHAQVLAAGGDPVLLGIARDDRDETRRLLARALEEDVVITSGGVSVGDYDFVKDVQEELGVERRFWKVRTKPGKPMAFGTLGDTLVFGAPGNPVAAMVSFELYVRPALLAMQGRRDLWRPYVVAEAAEPVKPSKDRVEARRCRVERDRDGGWRFSTTGPQGSGILRSMALADGLLFVPSGYPGARPGERFMVMLLDGSRPERPPFPE
jgi:molybdopterin molybdotransferase